MKDKMKDAQSSWKESKAEEDKVLDKYEKLMKERCKPPENLRMTPEAMTPDINPELIKSKEELLKLKQSLSSNEKEMWEIAKVYFKKALSNLENQMSREEYMKALTRLDIADFEEPEESKEKIKKAPKQKIKKKPVKAAKKLSKL